MTRARVAHKGKQIGKGTDKESAPMVQEGTAPGTHTGKEMKFGKGAEKGSKGKCRAPRVHTFTDPRTSAGSGNAPKECAAAEE